MASTHAVMSPAQLSAAARLFSPGVLRDLAVKGRSRLFARLASESGLAHLTPLTRPVRAVFDTAFSELQKGHRDEYIYKSAIAHKILLGKHSLATAAMLTEFRVANCKADAVILNRTSTVYEIKSERDNLDRLNAQVSAYLKAFARVNVITSDRHAPDVLARVPGCVGVLVLNARNQISQLRAAEDNVSSIVPSVVFDSLRLSESRRILNMFGIEVPNVPNTQLHRVQHELFVALRPEQVHVGMVEVLKRSRSQKPLAQLVELVPMSLCAAAISTPHRGTNPEMLRDALNADFGKALGWA
jgi:hypothetical protein